MTADDDAFTPPSEEPVRARVAGMVLLAWMMSGGAIGMALGLTAQVTGSGAALSRGLGLAGIVLMTVAGLVAIQIERTLAQSRPAVLSRSGQRERPLHVALYAIPMLLALPALVALVVVGSVAASSLVPAFVFGIGGFGMGWAARRLASSHVLTSALEALEAGDVDEAKRLLGRLENGWLTTHTGRTTARLNLGMLALSDGDLDRAARYYQRVDSGAGAAFARAGLALVWVLQDRLDEAETALLEAMSSPFAQGVQSQLDTVRLLLVMRQEDAETARATGEQLHTEEAGELFRGLLALLRVRTGDEEGAKDLADPNTLYALEESGWRQVIPEIAELLAEPALA